MNATYGTTNQFIDVTSIVINRLQVGDCLRIPSVISFNALFGDVAPKEPKYLILTNQEAKMSFPEIRNCDYEIQIGIAGSKKYWDLPKENQLIDVNTQKTHFLTYGNQKFTKSVDRICKEAIDSGFFNGSITGQTDVDKEFKQKFNYVLSMPRGGGYWIWKPHIIYQALEKIANNDILVYCDAGCTVNKKGLQKWQNLRKIVNESKFGIIGFQLTHKEAKYTNEKVFQHFKIALEDLKVRQSDQIMASIIIIRKCSFSQTLIKEWLDSLYQDEYLFTDEYNEFEISHQFEDHRHDQSMFSVLRKIRGCTILPDDTFAFDWSTVQDVPFLTTRIRE